MKAFIGNHEQRILRFLAAPDEGSRAAVAAHHERQIAYLQAERFAHLFVTLAFGFFTLGGTVAVILEPGYATMAFTGLCLLLLVPYIAHYFRLENAVQRWYDLANRLHGDPFDGREPQVESET